MLKVYDVRHRTEGRVVGPMYIEAGLMEEDGPLLYSDCHMSGPADVPITYKPQAESPTTATSHSLGQHRDSADG